MNEEQETGISPHLCCCQSKLSGIVCTELFDQKIELKTFTLQLSWRYEVFGKIFPRKRHLLKIWSILLLLGTFSHIISSLKNGF